MAIFFLLIYTLAEILFQVESSSARHGGPAVGISQGAPSAVPIAQKVAGLFSPFTLFDGVRMWLGGASHDADNVADPGSFGAVYALVLLILFGLCLYGLAARYRKARLS